MRRAAILVLSLVLAALSAAGAGAERPQPPPRDRLIGSPVRWSAFWHDQRWQPGDAYACALYAQASVLAALGYNFADELAAARAQGQRDGWYSPDSGAIGLGQPLRARGVRFEVHGTPLAGPIAPDRALNRLALALLAGRFVIANVNAQELSYYRGSAIRWHTLWITGMRLDALGTPETIIANDSTRGAAVEYPADEFAAAWGSDDLNYYAIFVRP